MLMMKTELRYWKMDDASSAAALFNGCCRTYMTGHLPLPYTEKDAERWLKHVTENQNIHGLWKAIVYQNEIVGSISLSYGDDVFCQSAEMGYVLDEKYWHRGIMHASVSEICREAFESFPLKRITASVFSPNTASRKVLEGCGFALEGIMRSAVFKNDQYYDLYIYGLLREEAVSDEQ